jgi:hypothetical protein
LGVVVTDVKETLMTESKRKEYFKKSTMSWQQCSVTNMHLYKVRLSAGERRTETRRGAKSSQAC